MIFKSKFIAIEAKELLHTQFVCYSQFCKVNSQSYILLNKGIRFVSRSKREELMILDAIIKTVQSRLVSRSARKDNSSTQQKSDSAPDVKEVRN